MRDGGSSAQASAARQLDHDLAHRPLDLLVVEVSEVTALGEEVLGHPVKGVFSKLDEAKSRHDLPPG